MIFSLKDPRDISLIQRALQGQARIGLTSGTYDLLHYLHFVFLDKCRRLCDLLIVGIDSDQLVQDTKGPDRPLVPEGQRVAMVNAMQCVDAVFVMDSTVQQLGIHVIFKNDAFKPEEVIGKELADVVIIPDVRIPDSTTAIVEECIQRRTKKGKSHGRQDLLHDEDRQAAG
jgi:D-beta-D-heptose 7-phosphate kinase/D-beta-D-heptose 1-phosphate adenosyltransferase